MGRVLSVGLMGRSIRGISWMTREKGSGFLSGMMEDVTRATGRMGSRTERGPISLQMEEYGKGFGKMGSGCAGSAQAPTGLKTDEIR